MLDKEAVGKRIEYYRSQTGLSQSKMAEKGKISDKTYTNAARGISNMTVSTLMKMCQALDVTPNDILLHEHDVVSVLQHRLEERFAKLDEKGRSKILQLLIIYADMEMEDK